MKKKIIWLVVSCLVALTLVLASCAPAAAPEGATPKEGAVAPEEDKPQYGGVITLAPNKDNRGFDQVYQSTSWAENYGQNLVNDRLMIGDWTKGPAGSGEFTFVTDGWFPEGKFRMTGSVAESWNVPDDQTLIFKIRKGVYWHNKAPVNGRQLTAEDIVFSIKYMYLNPARPDTFNVTSAPGGVSVTDVYLDPNDPWTVIVKVVSTAMYFLEDIGARGVFVVAQEMVEEKGDLKDWENAVGTGPFELTEYVPMSVHTFVRNPNYWMKNPIGPGKGDQLPYADGVKVLIISDRSTAQSALRTGKIDALGGWGHVLQYQDFQAILQTNPDTQWKAKWNQMKGIATRLTSDDPLAAPLLNQRVRWALSMAIDRETMIRDLYDGEAINYVHLFPPGSEPFLTPAEMVPLLEELGIPPDEAIMLEKMFEYNPEEAKKILAEEGYPNGFNTVILTPSTEVDYFSIIKGYWNEIGVDFELLVKEFATYKGIVDTHESQAMFYYTPGYIGVNSAGWVYFGIGTDPDYPYARSNRWTLRHPILDDIIEKTAANYMKDVELQNSLLQQGSALVLWLAPMIHTPGPNSYILWNPWLKNFHGATNIGLKSNMNFAWFAWIDQDLKEEMTGSR